MPQVIRTQWPTPTRQARGGIGVWITRPRASAADLIVLDENPLDNLEALRQVKMVMARGKLVSGLSVKHLPELDRELDTFLPR